MNYHNITHCDMKNGSGLRVVLWVSGCNHKCKNCQNPQTWSYDSGIRFDDDAKKELFNELSKDYISGITFSGGDPLAPRNRRPVKELMREIKEKFPNKNIWCYTGYTWDEIKDLFIKPNQFGELIDVLIDGLYIEELRDIDLEWRGSSNQNVIDVKSMIEYQKTKNEF